MSLMQEGSRKLRTYDRSNVCSSRSRGCQWWQETHYLSQSHSESTSKYTVVNSEALSLNHLKFPSYNFPASKRRIPIIGMDSLIISKSDEDYANDELAHKRENEMSAAVRESPQGPPSSALRQDSPIPDNPRTPSDADKQRALRYRNLWTDGVIYTVLAQPSLRRSRFDWGWTPTRVIFWLKIGGGYPAFIHALPRHMFYSVATPHTVTMVPLESWMGFTTHELYTVSEARSNTPWTVC
jgi:hypothetical protein